MNGTAPNDNVSNSPFVTLISNDGFEFHIRRSAACRSGTIRRMLDTESKYIYHIPTAHVTDSNIGRFREAITGEVHLETISGIVLEKVVEYFYYAEKHRDNTGVPDMDIPAELCLELLMAADFLDT